MAKAGSYSGENDMKIFCENLVKIADITPSTEADYLPASNVANDQRDKLWKSLGNTVNEYLIFNLGDQYSVRAIILFDANISGNVTGISLLASETNDFTGAPEVLITHTVISKTAATGKQTFFIIFERIENSNWQYFKLKITKSVSTFRIEIGKIFIGDYEEIEKDPDYGGFDYKWNDLSITERASGGNTFSQTRPKFRDLSLSYSNIEQTIKDQFNKIGLLVGTHTPFFIQVLDDPMGSLDFPMDEIIYVKLSRLAGGKVQSVDETLHWNLKAEYNEEI